MLWFEIGKAVRKLSKNTHLARRPCKHSRNASTSSSVGGKPGAVCMTGHMCHQASTHSHRDARGMVVSTELGSCTCVVPRTSCETFVEELEPRSDCFCAIISAETASETIQPFEQHLNTALPHVQRSRAPRSRQHGRVSGIPSYVSCILYATDVV